MRQFGIFIFILLLVGVAVFGTLVFYPAKSSVVSPADITQAISPVVQEVVASNSAPLSTSTQSSTFPVSSTQIITTSSPAKSTSTKIIQNKIVAPKVPILVPVSSGMQGEPAQIVISGIKDASLITSILVDETNVQPFLYKNILQGVYGIDINHKIGDFPIAVKLKDGTNVSSTLTITERKKPTLAFTIPESLGGTNPTGENNVTTLLTKENSILANLTTNPRKLWTQTFIYPTKNPVVTDPYGYNRDTGTQTVTHKGTDFHAPPGTPVYAINRGVVRLVKTFSIYGKTVIVDHGQGIQSFYMHLSKISVSQGSVVSLGQKIGESGETGYAEGPHLHLTARVNGVSIDPIKFFALYGTPPVN